MIAIIMGASVLSIIGVCFGLYTEMPPNFEWKSTSQDFRIMLCLLIFTIVIMTGLCWMILNLSISVSGDRSKIKARIYPFMRAYRTIPLSDISHLEIIPMKRGLSIYGGVGYKKQLGGITSYTLHIQCHILRICIGKRKELHVEISKVAEWKQFIEFFEKQKI